jgi:hypothetical protein
MNVYILLAAAIWWTFAVVLWVELINDCGRDIKDRAVVIGLAVFWPAVAIGVIPALIYQSCVASTAKLRADLRNRKLLGEFEDWLKQRAVED